MNAAEIIEMIKKLSPEERAQVMAFLREREKTLAESAGRVEETATERKIRFISKDEFEKLAPKIFAENRDLLRRLAQ
jgi:hypothetical protein